MPKTKPSEEAQLLFLEGKKSFELGNIDEALDNLNKALNFYRNSTEHPILAELQRLQGEIYYQKGNLIESRNCYKRAFISFKNFNHKIGMADSYDKIALSFMVQNELKYAEEYQEKAIEIRKDTPDKKGLIRNLKNLAIIKYKLLGDGEKALSLLGEALDIAKKNKDPQMIVNIALDQSKIQMKMDRLDDAMESAVIARRLSKTFSIKLPLESDDDFGELLAKLGVLTYKQGDNEKALKYLKNALLLLKPKNNPLLSEVELTISKIEGQIPKDI